MLRSEVKITETFWAWLAGFIDGEGHFALHKIKGASGHKYRLGYHWAARLSIGNNSRRTLEYIQRTAQKGCIHKMDQHEHYQIHYTSKALRLILPRIIPYLILKRKQAILLFQATRIIGTYQNTLLTNARLQAIDQQIKEEIKLNRMGGV